MIVIHDFDSTTSSDSISELLESIMPARRQAVIDANGKQTRY